MNKRALIVGNWKMYITRTDEATKFVKTLRAKAKGYASVEVLLAPPFTLLPTVTAGVKNTLTKVGAQNISQFADEKRTGEVSAAMAKAAGATFTIVGHSERRIMGETNTVVRAQVEHALAAGLMVVLCIGESERDPAGMYLSYIVEQLSSALDKLVVKPGKLVIAYEPVWAIGKSAAQAMKGGELRETSIFIKKTLTEHMDRTSALKVPILYGGAVEASNAKILLDEGDVNGLLVGHASASADSFIEILKEVAKK